MKLGRSWTKNNITASGTRCWWTAIGVSSTRIGAHAQRVGRKKKCGKLLIVVMENSRVINKIDSCFILVMRTIF